MMPIKTEQRLIASTEPLPEGTFMDGEQCYETNSNEPTSTGQPKNIPDESVADIGTLEQKHFTAMSYEETQIFDSLTRLLDDDGDDQISETEFIAHYTNPPEVTGDGYQCSDQNAFAEARRKLDENGLDTGAGFRMWQNLGVILQNEFGYLRTDRENRVIMQDKCKDPTPSQDATPARLGNLPARSTPVAPQQNEAPLDAEQNKDPEYIRYGKSLSNSINYLNENAISIDEIEMDLSPEEQFDLSPEDFDTTFDDSIISDSDLANRMTLDEEE